MARGTVIHAAILAQYFHRWSIADWNDRGRIVDEFAQAAGISKTTAYKRLQRLRVGERADSGARPKTRKKRKAEAVRAMEREHAKAVWAMKTMPGEQAAYWVSTEQAIRLAEKAGVIPEGIYSRDRMDRILRECGLSRRISQTRPAAMSLTAEYPGHVFVVDATPMNHYYLRLDGQIQKVVQFQTPDGDTHLDDLLERDGLYKIWVYYLVDMYSKTFLVRAFAPEARTGRRNGGENSDDWITFLTWAFLPKSPSASPIDGLPNPLDDCPLEGAPTILYCDKGSGIGKSAKIKLLCRHLGIKIETHLPGNPSAKGLVESRIGAFKRSFEVFMLKSRFTTLDEVNYFYQSWSSDTNRKRSFYQKWRQGAVERPIFRVTPENIQEAYVSHIERVIDGYGCVSIDGEKWFVTHEERYQKARVQLYRPLNRTGERRWFAETSDGIVFQCEHGAKGHGFDDIKAFPKSEAARIKDEARLVASQIRSVLQFEDLLPDHEDTNLRHMPNRAAPVTTHSAVAPDQFGSVEHARRWIMMQTGLMDDQIDEDLHDIMQKGFELSMKTNGYIPAALVIEFANILNRSKSEKENTYDNEAR